jgi:hypothetical protein
MSEDVRARGLDAFIEDLNRVRKAAGPPSYGRLERISRRLENEGATVSGVRVITLAKSTANDILTGVRRDRPKWVWVASFWAVLRLVAEQGGMDPGRLGSLAEWRRKYEAIDEDAGLAAEPEPVAEFVAGAVPELAGGTSHQDTDAAPGNGAPRRDMVDLLSGRLHGSRGPLARSWLLSLTRQARSLAWWFGDREVVPEWFETYLSLEPAADLIRVYAPYAVPGLLQTEQYAREELRARYPREPAALLEHRVDLRMRRQKILRGPDAPRMWAVIEERALRSGIGNVPVARAQIERLLELCALPHLVIQVIPAAPGGRLAGDGPIGLLRFPEADVPDLVYLEQSTYALYPDRPQDVNHYLQVLDRLAIEAAPPSATPDALHKILCRLESR